MHLAQHGAVVLCLVRRLTEATYPRFVQWFTIMVTQRQTPGRSPVIGKVLSRQPVRHRLVLESEHSPYVPQVDFPEAYMTLRSSTKKQEMQHRCRQFLFVLIKK